MTEVEDIYANTVEIDKLKRRMEALEESIIPMTLTDLERRLRELEGRIRRLEVRR